MLTRVLRSSVGRSVTVTFFVFATPLARSAWADAHPTRITYRAYAGCPNETTFVDEVAARTALARHTPSETETREFAVTVEREGDRVVGRLVIRTPDGRASSRQVEGETCGNVTSALALIAALAIDPKASTGELSNTSEPPAPEAAAPGDAPPYRPSPDTPPTVEGGPPFDERSRRTGSTPDAPDAPTPSDPAVRSEPLGWKWSAGVEALALGNFLPEILPAAGAFAEYGLDGGSGLRPSLRWAALVGGARPSFADGVGASVEWLVARMEVCPWRWEIGTRSLDVRICAAFDAGLLITSGRGSVDSSNRRVAPRLAAGGLARLAWRVNERLAFDVSPGVMLPFQRWEFFFTEGGREVTVYQTRRIEGTIGLAASYHFP